LETPHEPNLILCQFHLIQVSGSVNKFQQISFKYLLYFLSSLTDLIVGVVIPFYTHLYNLMAESFIGANRLPRENHHPSSSNE